MSELTDHEVKKITRRYTGLTPRETATRLRDRFMRRKEAVQRFTDRLQKDGSVDDASVISLRAMGVSDEEVAALIERYGKPL